GLWAMNGQLPERASGRLLAHHDGVPMEFSGELFFPGGATASFFTSFHAANQQWAVISGTQGFLHVPDFVVPFYGCEAGFEVNSPVFRVRGCDFIMESHPRRFAVHEYSSGASTAQETNMIRTFARIVTSGQLEPRWGEVALATQQVIDACLRSSREEGRAVPVMGEFQFGVRRRAAALQIQIFWKRGWGRSSLALREKGARSLASERAPQNASAASRRTTYCPPSGNQLNRSSTPRSHFQAGGKNIR